MLGAALGILWFDAWFEARTQIAGVGLLGLLLVVMPLAVRELATLFAAEKVEPYKSIASFGGIGLLVHAFCTQFVDERGILTPTAVGIVVLTMLAAALRRALRKTTDDAIVQMAGTLLATMYIGGLMWFLLALRVLETPNFTGDTMKVVFVLIAVKFTDIGAFTFGKLLGRHKLIPWLSPGKTWEGLAGGLLTAAGIGAGVAPFVEQIPWYHGAWMAAVLGLIGQGGDLLESMLKRDADVKDSGASIPGFGGVLDVIDSPLLAAPAAYLLFSLL